VAVIMGLDEARCPHCDAWISGAELDVLTDDDGLTVPMGAGSKGEDGLRVCPECATILG
jgi:hypothetical protein